MKETIYCIVVVKLLDFLGHLSWAEVTPVMYQLVKPISLSSQICVHGSLS